MGFKEKKSSNLKQVSFGIVHIQATFNNTIITITDVNGNTILSSSAGRAYKGARKSTPYAAQVTFEEMAIQAHKKGMRTFAIKVKGAGNQRDAAIRAVMNQKDFIVMSIADVSPIPHNGCRAPKRRRV